MKRSGNGQGTAEQADAQVELFIADTLWTVRPIFAIGHSISSMAFLDVL